MLGLICTTWQGVSARSHSHDAGEHDSCTAEWHCPGMTLCGAACFVTVFALCFVLLTCQPYLRRRQSMQVMQAATEAAHVATCTASMAACTSMQAQLELDVEKKQLRHSKPRMVDSDCDLSSYLLERASPRRLAPRGSPKRGGGSTRLQIRLSVCLRCAASIAMCFGRPYIL